MGLVALGAGIFLGVVFHFCHAYAQSDWELCAGDFFISPGRC